MSTCEHEWRTKACTSNFSVGQREMLESWEGEHVGRDRWIEYCRKCKIEVQKNEPTMFTMPCIPDLIR